MGCVCAGVLLFLRKWEVRGYISSSSWKVLEPKHQHNTEFWKPPSKRIELRRRHIHLHSPLFQAKAQAGMEELEVSKSAGSLH